MAYIFLYSLMAKITVISEIASAMLVVVTSVYIITNVFECELCSKLSHLGSQIKSFFIKSPLHGRPLVSLLCIVIDELLAIE